jgi:hypothetical protein
MDIDIRNEIMVKNQYLIKAALRRNNVLLKALRIENDDAFQELTIAMLKAIDCYNPIRSNSITSHISAKLQFAILDLKRKHKPYGITGTRGERVSAVSVECRYENDVIEIPYEDDRTLVEVSDIFAALAPPERNALNMRMDGHYLRRKKHRDSFTSACEKVHAMVS